MLNDLYLASFVICCLIVFGAIIFTVGVIIWFHGERKLRRLKAQALFARLRTDRSIAI